MPLVLFEEEILEQINVIPLANMWSFNKYLISKAYIHIYILYYYYVIIIY